MTTIRASGVPPHCDLCGRPFAGEIELFDVELSSHGGAWGWICAACAQVERAQIGWGTGQRYQREGDGWVLAAGGPREAS